MSFVSLVYGKLPKGNILVDVAEGYTGPLVTEIRGLRGGQEWVANAIEKALAYDGSGNIAVRWQETGLPDTLRRRIVVRQSTR